MGGAASTSAPPPPPPKAERSPPLETVEAVLKSKEGRARVLSSVNDVPPGTDRRWEKVLTFVNVDIAPTEEKPDPLRLNLNRNVVLSVLKAMHDGVKSLDSEGLLSLRQFMPKLYDKHTFDRAKSLSQKERAARGLADPCYAYGEIDVEVFTTIFLKITSTYGIFRGGIFYDLGCGVGSLVYSSAFLGNFKKVVGVENLGTLLIRGEQRMSRWDIMRESLNEQTRDTAVEWIEDDFLLNPFWKDGTFVLLHWTAFSLQQRLEVAKIMELCVEGTQAISFTVPIPGDSFEILLQDSCMTSWGPADFFFQEKITPASTEKK